MPSIQHHIGYARFLLDFFSTLLVHSPIDAVLKDVAEYVRSGKCVLFLGAGVHSPPPSEEDVRERVLAAVERQVEKLPEHIRQPTRDQLFAEQLELAEQKLRPFRIAYPAANAPPRGAMLAAKLAEGSEYAKQFPNQPPPHLSRAATHFEFVKGRPKLVQLIREQVENGRAPSPVLNALAQLPFALIITTNYDQLLETALRAIPKRFSANVYTPDESVATPGIDEEPNVDVPTILKIHGDIEAPESIVVTDEDYIQFLQRMGDKDGVNPVHSDVKFYLNAYSGQSGQPIRFNSARRSDAIRPARPVHFGRGSGGQSRATTCAGSVSVVMSSRGRTRTWC